MSADLDFAGLRIVETDNSSHVEPPLGQDWADRDKLRWHARTVEVRTGLAIRVGDCCRQTIDGHDVPGLHCVHVDRNTPGVFTSGAILDYESAWMYLRGVEDGAEAANMADEDAK